MVSDDTRHAIAVLNIESVRTVCIAKRELRVTNEGCPVKVHECQNRYH